MTRLAISIPHGTTEIALSFSPNAARENLLSSMTAAMAINPTIIYEKTKCGYSRVNVSASLKAFGYKAGHIRHMATKQGSPEHTIRMAMALQRN